MRSLVLLALVALHPAQASAYESLNVSLSDVDGVENVIYEAYLEEYAEELSVSSEQLEEDAVEVLLSGSNGSLDLEVLSKVGAVEVAFNPMKKSLYAEVDFMALALANEHKEKVQKSNDDAKWMLALTLVAVVVLAANSKKKAARPDLDYTQYNESSGLPISYDKNGDLVLAEGCKWSTSPQPDVSLPGVVDNEGDINFVSC